MNFTVLNYGPFVSTEEKEEEPESPKLSTGSNEAGGGDNEIEPACLSTETEHEKQMESKMQEILLETTGHKLQKQASVKKGLHSPFFSLS